MIYVSLTTIPQRLKNIDKSVQSLLKQSKKPDKIFINVPVKYKRFQETIEDHQLPKFDNDVVEIVTIDRNPRVLLVGEQRSEGADRSVVLDPDYVGARGHDLTDERSAEVHHRLQQSAFLLFLCVRLVALVPG